MSGAKLNQSTASTPFGFLSARVSPHPLAGISVSASRSHPQPPPRLTFLVVMQAAPSTSKLTVLSSRFAKRALLLLCACIALQIIQHLNFDLAFEVSGRRKDGEDVDEYIEAQFPVDDSCDYSHVLQLFDPHALPIRCSNFHEVQQGGKENVTGTGTSRKVKRGVWNGRAVAVKQVRGKKTPERVGFMEMEAAVHFNLRDAPNIVPLLGYCNGKSVFEFMPTRLDKACPLPPRRGLEVSLDAARAVAQLHGAPGGPFVHRDVATQNFMLDGSGKLFLQDFGAMQFVGMSKTWLFRHRCSSDLTRCGHGGVHRCPEEMVQMLEQGRGKERAEWSDVEVSGKSSRVKTVRARLSERGLDEKMDIYNLGFLVWEVFTGKKMHAGREWEDVWKDVLTGAWPPSTFSELESQPGILDILLDCWALDPARRPSAPEVADRIESLLKSQPSKLR